MTTYKSTTLPQAIVGMIGALTASLCVLAMTTASGPIAFTVAAAPIA
ncbi:hypothetical protein [Sphingomonas sp. CFBP 13720]|nr:hypothetical protein [Sphingomonas sp. CFBP 13720]MBD8677097.1 hypothetical protein [Sphingomonas sp. CFBP 13720]